MEEHDKNQEFSFIKEKIKEKPINKRRLFYKILWVVFGGCLFGLMACLTFVVAKPKLEVLVKPRPDTTVTFPKDQETGEEETGIREPEHGGNQENGGQGIQEPAGNQEAGESGNQEPEESVPEVQVPVYVERELGTEDYQALQNKLYDIGKRRNRSVVTVTGVTSNTDWFASAYESESQASGIIIANNGQELLILTEKKVIANAEAIDITFVNENVVPAVLKNYDGNTGLAVISVALGDISQETMSKIEVATLGNSLTVNQGTVVLALGSPLGANYSILCGNITSFNNTVSTWDSTYTIFTTNIMGSAESSGVLINLKGEVVGIVLQDYSSKMDQNTITALSVSQLKGIIESLSNGKDIPYLGVKVSTVTNQIATKYGLPNGVYVKNVETELPSPAMEAGLQEGDVIVEINGETVLTVDEYTQKLHALSPEQEVVLKVLRQSGEEYVELECTAMVGVHW